MYVIRSLINQNLYVGICKDIRRRLKEHNKGKNRYTKGLVPWELVYEEEFVNWQTARDKEKYYKSGVGKAYLKEKLVP